ncbi:MAG: TlpA family protein disulfide reductase [Bryobacterales bacterium]|nr:TlpA family protein disulfide reductase [Bryobacterales bacterium]
MRASRYNTFVRSVFRFFAALSVVTLLVLGSCSSSTSVRAAVKAEKDRKKAPDFELKDSMGRSVKLSDYKGKVVLLNFWATWCGPCKLEIPWFVEFEQKFKDKGFAVLGVSMDEDGWDVVKPYLQRAQVNYRVLLGTDSVAQMYGGVDSLPTSFLIDKEGRIAAVHVGLVSKGDYHNDINHLLGLGTKSRAGFIGNPLPAFALLPR